jgi:uncharacterized protein YdiU (UPF0061 family)
MPWTAGFCALPSEFHTAVAPTPLGEPYLVGWSGEAASWLGLAAPPDAAWLDVLSGRRVPAACRPSAAVYAGHQFGVYVPRLGDGRALLLGALPNVDGQPIEVQLKGAGRTPFSRMGDGRAVLRSSIREFLCSEAMHALGVPTTRALAVVGTDDPVFRETVETAAVVTRLAPSFVRFGSFEYFFWQQRHDDLRQLADYVVDTFYPSCAREPGTGRYLALLSEVTAATARLLSQWQGLGFCHGVMNTDNMSILGLTLDYGPFGFMDGFNADHVCNHSDEPGRYAYARQPDVAHWNLYCLGQALIPLTGDLDQTRGVLDSFVPRFEEAAADVFRRKLGFSESGPEDGRLLDDLLALMQAERTDWTVFWRRLADAPIGSAEYGQETTQWPRESVRDLFADRDAFDAWFRRYRLRFAADPDPASSRQSAMKRVNPRYVLRNHLAESAIAKARGDEGARDFSEVARLLRCLSRPYDEQPEFADYARLPPDWASNLQLSCSS